MAKPTDNLRRFAQIARDMEKEARRLTAERIQEDRVLNSASGLATSDIEAKYNLNSMGA